LTTIQALELLRGCQGLNIVGGDVVEVQCLIMLYMHQFDPECQYLLPQCHSF